MTASPAFADNRLWTIRSKLPGRLRLICQELVDSSLLRHHCAVTLNSCHWLQGFRINSLQGSVVVRFPEHRREDLILLLEEALNLPSLNDALVAPLAQLRAGQWRDNPAGRQAIRHGSACGLILLAEVLFPIPVAVMTGAALIALVPLMKEVWRELHHKRTLPAEAMELAFSGALISRGLGGEALLDLAIGDASDALKKLVTDEDEFHTESKELLDRLGNLVTLALVDSDQESCCLKGARAGDHYRVDLHCHVFLESKVVEGEIVVLNRLIDGDWRPRRHRAGDHVHPGAFLIKGQGVLEVLQELESHNIYQVPLAVDQYKLQVSRIEEGLKTYNRVMTPALLGLGGLLFWLGAVERALGVLQFNPVHDWETINISSRIAAMASLRLHGIHLNDPDALMSLGRVKHVVISRSCLDRIRGIQVREHMQQSCSWKKGDLVRFLAGVQDYLVNNDDVPIWSDQLHQVHKPMTVEHVDIQELLKGWEVKLADGRKLILKEPPQPINVVPQTHLDTLEIWEDNNLIGYVELINQPSEGWIGVCEVLEEMGIKIHVVGVENYPRMLELVKPLGIDHVERLYGDFHANDRLELVRDLQKNGDGVAYLGYVLHDMTALSQADVSIGIEVDAGSIFKAGICDVVIGADVHWLPRIIQMSRRMDSTATSNFGLMGGTNLFAAVAATAAWINPLTTVLLSGLPLLLADIRNITALTSHGVFETQVERTRALPPLPHKHTSCRLPKAMPHN